VLVNNEIFLNANVDIVLPPKWYNNSVMLYHINKKNKHNNFLMNQWWK